MVTLGRWSHSVDGHIRSMASGPLAPFEVACLCLSQPAASVRDCVFAFRQCLQKSLAEASSYDNSLCFGPVDLPRSLTSQLQNLRLPWCWRPESLQFGCQRLRLQTIGASRPVFAFKPCSLLNGPAFRKRLRVTPLMDAGRRLRNSEDSRKNRCDPRNRSSIQGLVPMPLEFDERLFRRLSGPRRPPYLLRQF